MRPILLLFGPTASGKTALAVQLAKAYNGEIVNADSRQIYSHMPLITAMPHAADFEAVPHHLFGFITPDQPYSVGQYVAQATDAIAAIHARGKWPIVVGGTGFYLKVLTEGISPIPAVPSDVTHHWQQRGESEGVASLYKRLTEVDPVLALTLQPTDTQRITRALAVQAHTARPLSFWQAQAPVGGVQGRVFKLGLNPGVDILNPRIDQRLQEMLAQGLLAEVAALQKAGYGLTMPGLSSIGCDLFYAHLAGQASLADVTSQFAQRQRQYAKRQRTWLRHQYKADMVLSRGEITTALQEKLAAL